MKNRICISVIIPTYNRAKELKSCLHSIYLQSIPPNEVLIIDDSDTDEVKKVVSKMKKLFFKRKIYLKYFRNASPIKSLTSARNYGVKKARGQIIFFFDDDVILHKDYIKNILNIYKKNPSVVGVCGKVVNLEGSKNKLLNLLSRFLYYIHFRKNKAVLLPSLFQVYAYPLTHTILCEWMPGNNCSYKREVFKKILFDEKLVRYSFAEDCDFSYRVFSLYKGENKYLIQTPKAKLVHKHSSTARLPRKETIFMEQVYKIYLFYKLFKPTLKNKLIFILSRFGLIFILVGKSLFYNIKYLHILRHLISAYIYCWRNLGKIKTGDLSFFNKRYSNL